MGRVSKVDECMFCGNTPCTCRSAKKAAPKPRAPRLNRKCTCGHIQDRHGGDKDCMECDCMTFTAPPPIARAATPPELSSQKADVTAAMKVAAQVKHKGATVKEDHDAVDETAMILDDPEMTAAIQALAPLMHPTEHRRFAQVLEARVDPKARAAAWKARHG